MQTMHLIAAGLMAGALGTAAPHAGPLPPRVPAEVTVTLKGLSSFTGALKGTCELDKPNNRLTVEGRGPNDLFVRLSVDYPAKAPFKVMMEGLGGGAGKIVGRVSSLVVNKYNYVASAGSGGLDDENGKSGHLRAEGFIQAGGTMAPQNLTADVAWKCQ